MGGQLVSGEKKRGGKGNEIFLEEMSWKLTSGE